MKVEIIAWWQVGLGFMASKDGVGIMLPIIIIFVSFNHWERFSFSFQKHF